MIEQRAVRIRMAVVGTAASVAVTAPAAQAQPAPPNNYRIVTTATDQCVRRAVMRVGRYDFQGNGWGYAKMANKHNLVNPNVFQAVLTDPTCGRPRGETAREYHKMAQLRSCWWILCTTVDEREVISLVDYRHDPEANGQRGMITTYCNQGGAWRCPTWVNSPPRFPPDTNTMGPDARSTVVTFTDAPAPPGTRVTTEDLRRQAG